MNVYKINVLLFFLISILSCDKMNREDKVDKNKLLASDYRLFQNTPAWELAKAVWDNDTDKIEEEVKKNPKIINYQDSEFGMSLLHMSLYNGQFKSFKELLRLGANPNISDSMHCTSPIIQACEDFDDKIKYVKELIKYKADVNYVECSEGKEEQKTNRTPLITASSYGHLKIVKLLVDNGAYINYDNNRQAGSALGAAVLSEKYDIALYLLERGADCNKVLYKRYNADNSETPIYMRDIISKGGEIRASKEYNKIVEILKKKGCIDEYPADYPR
jgi:ankyrin repeat protein